MKDLLIALYAIVLSSAGQRGPEVKAAVSSTGIKDYFDDITYLKDVCTEVYKGKSVSMFDLGNGLKDFLRDYKSDQRARPAVVALLRSFVVWMRAGNERAWLNLERNSSSELFPEWVRKGFTKKVASQKPYRDKAAELVQKMTGVRGRESLPADLAEKARAKYPELYKEYLGARRGMNKVVEDEISNFVRDSGGRMVDYSSLLKYLKSKGIKHFLPEGFTGKIDAVKRVYTKDGEEVASLPTANMFPTVKMNEAGKGDWIYQAVREDGSPGNYFYTKKFTKQRVAEKYEKVKDLSKNFDRIRTSWKIGVLKYDESSPYSTAAVILELLYQFSARIGSLGNSAGGSATYGLGTLRVKHVTPTPNGFVMRYKGKDGVPAIHKYEGVDPLSKRVVSIVKNLLKGKGPSDLVWTVKTPAGDDKFVPPAIVNRVFKTLGSGQATIHKLRTLRGTSIFNAEVAKIYESRKSITSQSEALALIKAIATKVGKELNHVRRGVAGTKVSPNTALSSYIDVSSQIAFFQHYGLPLPNYLARSKVVVDAKAKKTKRK